MDSEKPSVSFDSSESDELSLEEFERQEAQFEQLYNGSSDATDTADCQQTEEWDDPSLIISAITEKLQQIALQCEQLSPSKPGLASPSTQKKVPACAKSAASDICKADSEASARHDDESQNRSSGESESLSSKVVQESASDVEQCNQTHFLALLKKKEEENTSLKALLAEKAAQLDILSTKLQLVQNERDDLINRLDKIMSGSLVPDDENDENENEKVDEDEKEKEVDENEDEKEDSNDEKVKVK